MDPDFGRCPVPLTSPLGTLCTTIIYHERLNGGSVPGCCTVVWPSCSQPGRRCTVQLVTVVCVCEPSCLLQPHQHVQLQSIHTRILMLNAESVEMPSTLLACNIAQICVSLNVKLCIFKADCQEN